MSSPVHLVGVFTTACALVLAGCSNSPQTEPSATKIDNAPAAQPAPPTPEFEFVQVGESAITLKSPPAEVFDHVQTQLTRLAPSARVVDRSEGKLVMEFDARDIGKAEPSVKVMDQAAPVRMVYEVTPDGEQWRVVGRSLRRSDVELQKFPQLSQMVASLPLMIIWSGTR